MFPGKFCVQVRKMQGEPDRGQHIWAVGGGKGGIGKSLIASNFAIVLASLGKNVVAVDLDLGNANMHTCLGVRYPQKTLGDFLSGKVHDLNEIILDTSLYNLKFIGGSGGIMGSANPWYAQKLKLLRYLENLHVDHIVLDLGAGTSYNIIDFFLGATDHLLITTPEMTSIQSVYNFVRICMFRKLRSIFHKNSNAWSIVEKAIVPASDGQILKMDALLDSINGVAPESVDDFRKFQKSFRPSLIMNMILKNEEAKLGMGLTEVIKRYLDINVDYPGSIVFDKIIRKSLDSETPLIMGNPKAHPSQDIITASSKIIGNNSNDGMIRNMIDREISRTSKLYRRRIIESRKMDVDPSIYVIDKVKTFKQAEPEDRDFDTFFNIKAGTWSKIAIDIGTSNTRIYVKGRGIVLNEPSLMSIEESTEKVVALGHDAKAMLGRSHSGIKIIAPMDSGVISDYTDVRKLIREFIRYAKQSTILIRPGIILTIQLGLTSVERKAVQEFVGVLGARDVNLVYEPFAAAVGAGLPVDVPKASMLVNIGGGATSAVVISISGIVSQASRRTGSKAIDTSIIRYLRDSHSFLIGGQTAEWIKINFAQARKIKRDKRFMVRGQDIALGVPKTISISTAEIREAIEKPVNDILKVIQQLLEHVPPELSGDLVDRGMTLTGGGALLHGFDQLITDMTGIKVRIAPNAQTAAVEGSGRMLDDFKFYNKFFVNAEGKNK
jgi:rod shape-determining protein MreB and related proteins